MSELNIKTRQMMQADHNAVLSLISQKTTIDKVHDHSAKDPSNAKQNPN